MIPISYNVRSLTVRKGTTAAAVFGIALVTFLFAAVFMLNNGIKRTLATTARPTDVIVMRFGSDGEMASFIESDKIAIVSAKGMVAHAAGGNALSVGEIVVVITLDKMGTSGMSNVQIRGVPDNVWEFRPEAKLIAGRKPQPGTDEVAVGKAIRGRFQGTELGQTFELKKNRPVKVVGIFDAGGSSFESEVWTDLDFLRQAFGRQGGVSSVRVRLDSPSKFDAFKNEVESVDKTLGLQATRESVYYENLSTGTSMFILILGVVISVFFSFGAIIGAAITMYAQVSNRTKEIGTLRALGFSKLSILTSFVLEALIVAASGGVLGILGSFALANVKFSTLNFSTFSEIVFRFETTPGIIIGSILISLLMGLVGGFLPALRAARMSPLAAIRA